MNKKEAKEITGGLSKPSKMPGHAYNLPAWRCKTGVKLQAVAGSVCAGCYAMKGRYRFKMLKTHCSEDGQPGPPAMASNGCTSTSNHGLDGTRRPSGLDHLNKIFEVCRLTPETSHSCQHVRRRS